MRPGPPVKVPSLQTGHRERQFWLLCRLLAWLVPLASRPCPYIAAGIAQPEPSPDRQEYSVPWPRPLQPCPSRRLVVPDHLTKQLARRSLQHREERPDLDRPTHFVLVPRCWTSYHPCC